MARGPAAAVESRQFRFAVAYEGSNWDFAWTFHTNLARISLQETLTAAYPDTQVDHVHADVPQSWTTDCDPQFAAWCAAGVDMIIAAEVGYQFCVAELAKSYQNVTFLGVAGTTAGPSNYANLWVRFYQPAYLAGYTAGLMTRVKKVCISACIPLPDPVVDVSSFSRGVRSADPSVEIHILGTGQLRAPLLEVWIVNQSYALGCDVIWVQSLASDGIQRAYELGMMSIGFFSDARLTVGDTVITSVVIDFAPPYIRAAEAVLNGTFQSETQKADWWMDWKWGAMSLGKFSFVVPSDVQAKVLAQVPAIDHLFCGRVCTKSKCFCNASSCCLTDEQLYSLGSYPDFVVDHGIMQLPGKACPPGQHATWHLDTFTLQCADCPAGTYAYNQDETSECIACPATTYSLAGSTQCTACPAGTYGNQPGLPACPACPAGSIAPLPASRRCDACPSGISNTDGVTCGTASLAWLAGVGVGVGVPFLLIGAWVWWASHKMRKLRKQFSNDTIAVECAAAIARLDLQAVAWLQDIPKPNCIQASFIRIVKILEEVRKYVPDQLLQSLAHADDAESDREAEEKSLPSLQDTPRSQRSICYVLPADPAHRSSRRSESSGSQDSGGGGGLFSVRKVTYLQVQFNMDQHRSPAPQAEGNLKLFLGFLIDAAKARGGTVGAVLYDHAVVHWGTGRRAVAEAPLRAVETALALTDFANKLNGSPALDLAIVVGCGHSVSGIVETAAHRFFVVGGGQVPVVQRIAAKNLKSLMGVQVLITDSVRSSVQYHVLCHPRLVDGEDLLWEPLGGHREAAVDEWMYQLKEAEGSADFGLEVLAAPFTALRRGEFTTAELLARTLLQQRAGCLHPTDVLALEALAKAARLRSTHYM
eukprot:EG_transcript_1127